MSAPRWEREAPGVYRYAVTLVGAYVAERVGRAWVLSYEGGWSQTVGTFPTLREAKRYVDPTR